MSQIIQILPGKRYPDRVNHIQSGVCMSAPNDLDPEMGI